MKRTSIIVLACLFATVLSAAAFGDIFSFVKATSQGDEIKVQWRSSAESNIHSYEIERKSDEVTDFRRLGRIEARGDGSSYSYIDNGAFYKSQAGKEFTYRVKAIGTLGEYYSPVVTVSHEVSSVKRSWGMIKELFR